MDAKTQLKRMITLLGRQEHIMILDIVSRDTNAEKCILSTGHGTYLNLQWLTPKTIQKITEYVCYWIEITKIHNEEESKRKTYTDIIMCSNQPLEREEPQDNLKVHPRSILPRVSAAVRANTRWVRKINKLLIPQYCRKIFDS